MKKTKRILVVAMAALMALSAFMVFPHDIQATNAPIRVKVDGVRVNFPDQQPVIVNGRTLVPLRAAMEAIGFYVRWDEGIDSAFLSKPHPRNNTHTLELMIPMRNIESQSFFATTAGRNQHLHGNIYTRANKVDASPMGITTAEVPPQNINGRLMVPLRVIAEIAGMTPTWDEATRTANIVSVSSNGVGTTNVPSPSETPETANITPRVISVSRQRISDREVAVTVVTTPTVQAVGVEQMAHTGSFGLANLISETSTTKTWVRNMMCHRETADPSHDIIVGHNPPVRHTSGGWMRYGDETLTTFRWFSMGNEIEIRESRSQAIVDLSAFNVRGGGQQANQSPQPTPNPSPTPVPAQTEWVIASSNITLPNRRLTDAERQAWIDEYHAMGGATSFEIEVVRIINELRAERGAGPLQISNNLMMAARLHTQLLTDLNFIPVSSIVEMHSFGPLGGSFGATDLFGGIQAPGNAAGGHTDMTPSDLVNGWMSSPPHRDGLMDPNRRFIGVGSMLGGYTGVLHYSFTANGSSD